MYIDPDIKLPDNLPEDIQRDVRDLTEYYNSGEDMKFLMIEEAACATIKQALLSKRIDEKTLDLLFRYYGWR